MFASHLPQLKNPVVTKYLIIYLVVQLARLSIPDVRHTLLPLQVLGSSTLLRCIPLKHANAHQTRNGVHLHYVCWRTTVETFAHVGDVTLEVLEDTTDEDCTSLSSSCSVRRWVLKIIPEARTRNNFFLDKPALLIYCALRSAEL